MEAQSHQNPLSLTARVDEASKHVQLFIRLKGVLNEKMRALAEALESERSSGIDEPAGPNLVAHWRQRMEEVIQANAEAKNQWDIAWKLGLVGNDYMVVRTSTGLRRDTVPPAIIESQAAAEESPPSDATGETRTHDVGMRAPDHELPLDLLAACEYNFIVHDDIESVELELTGYNDGDPWHWIVKTKAGFAYITGSCDCTGWDCRSNAERFNADAFDAVLALVPEFERRILEEMRGRGEKERCSPSWYEEQRSREAANA